MTNRTAVTVVLALAMGAGYCTYSQCQASSESRQQATAGVQRVVAFARANAAEVDLGRMYLTFLRDASPSMTARERTALEEDIRRHLGRSAVVTIAAFRDVQEDAGRGGFEAVFEGFLPYCPFELRLKCSRSEAQELAARHQFPLTVAYRCSSVSLNLIAGTRDDGPMAVIRGRLAAWEPSGKRYPMHQSDIDEAMR